MTDEITQQRFRRDLAAEIARRASEYHYHMNRQDVEAMGEQVGLNRDDTNREFFACAGRVWVGQITPAEGRAFGVTAPRRTWPDWLSVDFDTRWLRRREILPSTPKRPYKG